MKVAQLDVELRTGGFVSEFIQVKSEDRLRKKMNKMMRKGDLDFGGFKVPMDLVDTISVRWHELH